MRSASFFFASLAVLAGALALASGGLLDGLFGSKTTVTKVPWNGFHATWGKTGVLGYSLGQAFYDLPTSAADAAAKGWTKARDEEQGSLWCLPDDPRVCIVYDQQGSVAGIQVAFLLDDLSGTPYDWRQHSLFFEDTIFDQEVAAGRLYLVSQDVLKSGGRSSVDEIGTGVWLKDGDSLVNVPQNASQLEALGWTRENCINNMGRHYYFNMSESLDCLDFEPFFVLVDNSKNWVHGMGFQTFGLKSKKDRDWDEVVPGDAVKPTIPNAPACLTDWADTYGVLSIHMYFTTRPYLYFC